MKKAIARTLKLDESEFDFDINVDELEEINEVIVWGGMIDTVVISIENLELAI